MMSNCKHAASGCDYPAGECGGACMDVKPGQVVTLPAGVDFPAPAASGEYVVQVAGDVLQRACHSASVNAGWWQDLKTGTDYVAEVRSGSRLGKALVAEKLALVHSEVSKALEGHRKGLQDDKLPHRPMIEVELADAVIRIADLAGALGLDLGGAIAEKMAFNAVRPDHKLDARQSAGGKAY